MRSGTHGLPRCCTTRACVESKLALPSLKVEIAVTAALIRKETYPNREKTVADLDQLIVEQIQIGPMQNFAYLIGDKATRESLWSIRLGISMDFQFY